MNEHLAELHPGEGVGVGVGVLRSVSVGECKCITFSEIYEEGISNLLPKKKISEYYPHTKNGKNLTDSLFLPFKGYVYFILMFP